MSDPEHSGRPVLGAMLALGTCLAFAGLLALLWAVGGHA